MNEVRLIDANALKEELLKDKYISWDCEYAVTHEDIKRVIDNFPTVEGYKNVIVGGMNNPYNAGYMEGIRQAYKELERPQGEWTFDERGYFYCGKCGKYPHDQYATTDFCPKCGANMQKGGAE